jgi:hypothetical protein
VLTQLEDTISFSDSFTGKFLTQIWIYFSGIVSIGTDHFMHLSYLSCVGIVERVDCV